MKHFITAILFMFMIGMVIDISPQSSDPPSQEQIELEKNLDLMAVSHQETELYSTSGNAHFKAYPQAISDIDLSEQEAGKFKGKTTAIKESVQRYSDKHYDPGSCGSYMLS